MPTGSPPPPCQEVASVRGGSAETRRPSRPAVSRCALGRPRAVRLNATSLAPSPSRTKAVAAHRLALNCNLSRCYRLQICANEEPRLSIPAQPSPFEKPTQPHFFRSSLCAAALAHGRGRVICSHGSQNTRPLPTRCRVIRSHSSRNTRHLATASRNHTAASLRHAAALRGHRLRHFFQKSRDYLSPTGSRPPPFRFGVALIIKSAATPVA